MATFKDYPLGLEVPPGFAIRRNLADTAFEVFDTTALGGGSPFTLTQVEVSLGSEARRSGKFSITTTGLTANKNILITQTNGPYTGKGTRSDEAEMDSIRVIGKTTSTTNIDCFWQSQYRCKGNYKFGYVISA